MFFLFVIYLFILFFFLSCYIRCVFNLTKFPHCQDLINKLHLLFFFQNKKCNKKNKSYDYSRLSNGRTGLRQSNVHSLYYSPSLPIVLELT